MFSIQYSVFSVQCSVLVLVAAVTWRCDAAELGTPRKYPARDSILAIVNDQAITVYEALQRVPKSSKDRLRKKYRNADLENPQKRLEVQASLRRQRAQAAQELIDQEIIYAEFKKRGRRVSPGYLAEQLARVVARETRGDAAKFIAMLNAQQKMTLADYKAKLRKDVAVGILLSQEVSQHARISPQAVATWYQKHLSTFTQPAKVCLQMLVLKKHRFAGPVPLAQKVAEVDRALLDGMDFAEAVKKYSHGFAKEKGGDLPWLNEQDVKKEFRTAFAEMKKGACTPAIHLANEVYWLRIKDFKPSETIPLKRVRRLIQGNLLRDERRRRYAQFINKLRRLTHVRLYYAEIRL